VAKPGEAKLRPIVAPDLAEQLEGFGIQGRAKRAIEDAMRDPDLAGRQLVRELYPYRRLKVGRYRIIYRVVPENQEVRFLYCGIRKEGSKKDVYVKFAKELTRGLENA
jgi:mRNA-degrading endonuclease RelE of RelBE toxin-antitoxin system